MLIDSHVHLDHVRYADDREALLDRAWAAGVRGMLLIGIGDGPETMHRALDLAREHAARPQTPKLWASAGIHPQEAALATPEALAALDALLAEPGIVACGEIGLDYYHAENPPRERQMEAFVAQLSLAARHQLPILIHCRPGTAAGASAAAVPYDAWDDILTLLDQHWAPTGLRGVLHCFSGLPEHARRGLNMGFLLSFAGNLTYPSASALREIARVSPLGSLLVETDGPFLAPVPHRGQRNEPAFVAHTAKLLAELHGVGPDALAEQTTSNFHSLFGTHFDLTEKATPPLTASAGTLRR